MGECDSRKTQKKLPHFNRLYRSIVAEQNDDILPVRLQLAIALLKITETEAAEDGEITLRTTSSGTTRTNFTISNRYCQSSRQVFLVTSTPSK